MRKTMNANGSSRSSFKKTNYKRFLPARGRRVDGPAEVGDLELALHVEEKVLRLDITVDHLKH